MDVEGVVARDTAANADADEVFEFADEVDARLVFVIPGGRPALFFGFPGI